MSMFDDDDDEFEVNAVQPSHANACDGFACDDDDLMLLDNNTPASGTFFVDDDDDMFAAQAQTATQSTRTASKDSASLFSSEGAPRVISNKPRSSRNSRSRASGMTKHPSTVIPLAQSESNATEPVDEVFKDHSGPSRTPMPVEVDSLMRLQKYGVQVMLSVGSSDPREAAKAENNLKTSTLAGQTKRIGTRAATVLNHMLRIVNNKNSITIAPAASVVGSDIVQPPPLTTPSSGVTTTFVAAVIETTPCRSIRTEGPSHEKMRQASQPVLRDWIEHNQKTATNNQACCNADCVGLQLLDAHSNPIEGTRLQAFFFPNEINAATVPKVLDRPCILCMIRDANNYMYGAMRRGNVIQENVLFNKFHVLCNVSGQYPVAATIGMGTNGHNGIYGCVPRFSLTGWVAHKLQAPGAYRYVQESMPSFPLPEDACKEERECVDQTTSLQLGFYEKQPSFGGQAKKPGF